MAWLLIVILLLLTIVGYLLFAPFYLEIDTTRDIYQVRFHRLAVAGIAVRGQSLVLGVRVIWWKKEIDLRKMLFSRRQPTNKKDEKKRREHVKRAVPFRKVLAVLRSFGIRECVINVDFGEVTTNGMLFPAAWLASRATGRQMEVNFVGYTVVILTVRNNLARMAWAYMRA